MKYTFKLTYSSTRRAYDHDNSSDLVYAAVSNLQDSPDLGSVCTDRAPVGSPEANEFEFVEFITFGATSFDLAILRLQAIASVCENLTRIEDLHYRAIYTDTEGWLYSVKPVWRNLYSGSVTAKEVQTYVKDPEWQCLRKELKGTSLEWKYVVLRDYLLEHPDDRARQVRVTNYITALSRGGLIKPEDYR